MDLVRILDEEGFGALAGELLTEVNLGREGEEYEGDQTQPDAPDLFETAPDVEDAPDEDADEEEAAAGPDWILLDNETKVQRRYVDLDGGRGRAAAPAQPIPLETQLGFALELLRLRLIEPMRRLADAEQMAGQIAAESERADRGRSLRRVEEDAPTGVVPVRIAFVDTRGTEPPTARDRPGDAAEIDKLDDVLARLRLASTAS